MKHGTNHKALLTLASCLLVSGAALTGCSSGDDPQPGDGDKEYSNPFTDPDDGGKEDTGYYNQRGVEMHVTLEADLEADSWRMFDGPAELAQFAVTRLRNRDDFYLELLAEDTATPDRVEWLVDGEWLDREQAEQVDRSLLRRFRLQNVNAVVLDRDHDEVNEGQVFTAEVPVRPYSVMSEAGDKCATYNSHITLSQSVYWYLWNPTKSGCDIDKQDMTVTITEVLPRGFDTYPEYDRLWEDDKITVAVFWAKLDDGDVADDYNWGNVDKFTTWLTEADFQEQADMPLGRRFVKESGGKHFEVDVYGPDVFHSVADYGRLQNWQQAVSTHEVVIYNGHSVLGTGMAFEQIQYPDFYQVFQIASCLSYEYYVRPILEGKGGWENVDIVSNVEPTYYSENLPLTGALLAKLFWGFEHQGQASWKDVMENVSRKLGHSRFGVSGARDNCYSPQGNKCEQPDCMAIEDEAACGATAGCKWVECPPNVTCDRPYVCTEDTGGGDEIRYESSAAVAIPDNDHQGAASIIDVPDDHSIGSLRVELDITHTYTGDLEIVLYRGDEAHVLWQRDGGSSDDVKGVFDVPTFDNTSTAGSWTLQVTDRAAWDTGTINHWALLVTPAE